MWRLALKSGRFYWRMHLGVLCGVVLASAVLTGALLVGDSVDGSLRDTALARLGNIDYALHTPNRYFDIALAQKMEAAPILSLPGVALSEERQINQVNILGIDETFSSLAHSPLPALSSGEIAINEKLAAALQLGAGDTISLRITKPSLMPRDAALAQGEEVPVVRVLTTVAAVLTDAQLGRFNLANNQITPYNAFVSLAWLQERLELEARINGLLLTAPAVSAEILAKQLHTEWAPADVGTSLRTAGGVRQLESDRIYLDSVFAEAALTLPAAQGSLVYLINSIATESKSTPYSFALATGSDLGPEEALLNTWTADQIGAAVGDEITVGYYVLSASNDFEEKERRFMVKAIVATDEWEAERALMLAFPGLTDVESCADWDIGMPMDEEKLADPENEAYWEDYGPTPKIMISLAAGQEMWSNRFGAYTGIRFSDTGLSDADILGYLKENVDPAALGLRFRPVRAEAMLAVEKAIDFGGLFLGMSFFLIIAALIFTGLLFVFGVQQRTREMGLLASVGFTPKKIRRMLILEILPTTLLGVMTGAVVGMLYARLMLAGLALFWQGAVAGAVIQYHGTFNTLFNGATITLCCAMITLYLTIRRQSRHSAREQLQLDFSLQRNTGKAHPLLGILPVIVILCALGLSVMAIVSPPTKAAPAFFGIGSLMLASLLAGLGSILGKLRQQHYTLPTRTLLALQNLARRRGRSLTAAGLLACGSFMIFAVSAMQEDLETHAHERWSGTGGFNLVATASIPIRELSLAEGTVISLRVRDGDDASCLNLNRAQSPTIIGVPSAQLEALRAFGSEDAAQVLWGRLNATYDQGIPALVGDTDTAMWGLQKKAHPQSGAVLNYHDESGSPFEVMLVDKLPMRLSVFQGKLLIDESDFTQHYPSESGYRMFLLEVPPASIETITTSLREDYERYGLEVYDSVDWLRTFYTVESTYLGMFLVLGGFGMLLGSAALSVVVLRNLLERRTELAMLRAVGFSHRALWKLLTTEQGLLVLSGLLIGGLSAAIAMIPAFLTANTSLSFLLQGILFLSILACAFSCVILPIWLGTREEDFQALRRE